MFLKIFAGFAAVVAGMSAAAILAVAQGGFATVTVQNDEVSLFLPIPLALVGAALYALPEDERAQVRGELEPVRPLVMAALGELGDLPDVTLVEVESPGERVLIRKDGDDLTLDILSEAQGRVRVKVPVWAVGRTFAAIAERSGADARDQNGGSGAED